MPPAYKLDSHRAEVVLTDYTSVGDNRVLCIRRDIVFDLDWFPSQRNSAHRQRVTERRRFDLRQRSKFLKQALVKSSNQLLGVVFRWRRGDPHRKDIARIESGIRGGH